VVPPWLDEDRDELEWDFLPPRLEAPGEFAIFAARSFDIPLSFSASYCFSFLTFARLLGIGAPFSRFTTVGFPLLGANKPVSNRATLWDMGSRGDSWESVGWEAAWQQPEEDADRDQVLRLARQLAEARERQNVEALLQVEDLKRALRERAADVARRELEVERRTRELEKLDERGREGRRLRLRRSERPQGADDAYAEELLARRETELQRRLDALVPREHEVAERETALRARELEVEEAETKLASREQEVTETTASVESRRLELESSYARLRESEAALTGRQAALEDQERLLERSRAEISRTTDEIVERAAALEAAEQALEAERSRLADQAEELEQRGVAARAEEERGADERDRRFATLAKELEERANVLDERELGLAAREREAAVVEERSAAEGERMHLQLDSQLAAREAVLLAREAELLRLQAGLAAQQESIRRRERALDDAERLRERETALPAAPYVSFTEGLDAFSAGRPRSG
jgi:hypothetical protein